MGASSWLARNWFELLQTVGILGGLVITAVTVRKDERARKITNSIAINEQHREIWKVLFIYPELSRVMVKDRNLEQEPASELEELFVKSLIVHLSTVFRAMKQNEFVRLEGLGRDARVFFSLPIARITWAKVREFHDRDFVGFVEDLLK